jgi:diaminopimelate epimerase
VRLAKWQGLGNVYLIMEEASLPAPLTPEAVGLLCDRYLGVGSDGILLRCEPSGAVAGAVTRMRVLNPDGSEPEMCGNGIRMFARYLHRSGAVSAPEFVVETLAGAIKPRLLDDGTVRVDMGTARFRSDNVDLPGSAEVVGAVLQAGGCDYEFTFADVGNPHCIVQVADPASFDVCGVGPLVEHHPCFPNRANAEFIRVEPDGSVTMRVWERGVGETQACGTGATAVGAACVRLGLTTSPVVVHLLGGDLTIEVGAGAGAGSPDGTAGGASGCRVFMTGPAEEVCTCDLSDDMLRRLGWPVSTDN